MADSQSITPSDIFHPLKCSERGCPFPPAPGEILCSYHAEIFSSESSYVQSSLSRAISYRNAIDHEGGLQETEPEWHHVMQCRKQWDAEGRCIGCGGQRDKLTKHCSLCLTEIKRRWDALLAAGLCTVCARESDRAGRVCSVCLSRLLFVNRNRRARRRAAGLCARRVSTTLRQVLTEFSELFMCAGPAY